MNADVLFDSIEAALDFAAGPTEIRRAAGALASLRSLVAEAAEESLKLMEAWHGRAVENATEAEKLRAALKEELPWRNIASELEAALKRCAARSRKLEAALEEAERDAALSASRDTEGQKA